MDFEKPLPVPTATSQPFWEALTRHEVHIQQCAACRAWVYYPRAFCPRCLSPELECALRDLPPAQREAVELIHLEGLSVVEAAARAGVSRSALKVRAHRGYRALRAQLGSSDFA